MKVVLKAATPWPLPRGLMHPSGTVLEVSESDAVELRERGLIQDEDQDTPDGADDADEVEETSPSDEEDEQETPAEPAASTGKKYPPLPKKSVNVNVWREYARTNDIDIRSLSDAAEIKGHIMKVVGGE